MNLDLWYAVPLVVASSLVYAATRHERIPAILLHSLRVGLWIVGFMAIFFAVMLILSWQT